MKTGKKNFSTHLLQLVLSLSIQVTPFAESQLAIDPQDLSVETTLLSVLETLRKNMRGMNALITSEKENVRKKVSP